MFSDADENPDRPGSQTRRRLRDIAEQLGQPVELFYGTRPDADAELQELLRLWHIITDPVSRQRLLDLARQEAQ